MVFAVSRYAVEIFDGRTLHQPASLSLDQEENVSNVYYIPLLITILGFYGAFFSLLLIRTRTEIRMRSPRAGDAGGPRLMEPIFDFGTPPMSGPPMAPALIFAGLSSGPRAPTPAPAAASPSWRRIRRDERAERAETRNWTRFLPVLGFFAVALAFQFGLNREDASDLPSTFIDKPAPATDLPALLDDKPGFTSADLADGNVKLVNIWASWCGPCRVEHPFLMALAEEGVEIHGFNYKDTPGQAKLFLQELGDPYTRVGTDQSGRAGIEWGVYGVPETFVIDGSGQIVYKHVGPIVNDDVSKKIRPAIEEAKSRG